MGGGPIQYKHTNPVNAGSVYNVASGFFPTSTTVQVGTTVNNDCGKYPAHLHQGRAPGSYWAKQTQSTWVYPTWSTCHTAGCNTYTSPWQYWQHGVSWLACYAPGC